MTDFAAAVAESVCDADLPDDDAGDPAPRRGRGHAVRSRTLAVRQMGGRELRPGSELWPSQDVARPRRRADCRNVPRPCPFVACRWHLYLDVGTKGSIKFNFPDLEPDELAETCALDVADRGGTILERVGDAMNMTRERVRQVEEEALAKLRAVGGLAPLRGIAGPIERESFLPQTTEQEPEEDVAFAVAMLEASRAAGMNDGSGASPQERPAVNAEAVPVNKDRPAVNTAPVPVNNAAVEPQEVREMGKPKNTDEQIIAAVGSGPITTGELATKLGGVCPDGLTPRLEELVKQRRLSGGERASGTGRPRVWRAAGGKPPQGASAKANRALTGKEKRRTPQLQAESLAESIAAAVDREAKRRAVAILRAHADEIEAELERGAA